MSYTNNDEAIALVDANLTPLAVSQSQAIDVAIQPGYVVAGVSGSTATFFKVSSDGTMHITGSVALDSTINVGTVTQGPSGSVPWLITGSVTVNNPSAGGSGGTVTQGPSGSEYWKITGSVGISQIVVVTGSTTINNFPVTQSVKIDQSLTLPVSVSNFPSVQTITGSVGVNNLTFVSGSNLSVFITSSNTLPITGTILSLPFGTQTVTGTVGISQIVTITGSVTQNNFPVTQSVKLVDIGTNVTQSITGSVSVNNLTFVSGSNLSVFITGSNMLPVTGTVLSLPFGTQTITGSIFVINNILPVSVSNFPSVQTITGSVLTTVAGNSYGGQIEGRQGAGSPILGNPVLIGGGDGSTARTMQVDSLGRIITAPAGSSAEVTASLSTGYVVLAATTRAAVRNTAYTEQTTNAQRSIVSANAADAAAGTGARTVQIVYFDQNYNGPFSETITMNGTTAVNTVNTNICFLEQIYVLTVGSGGTNAGIISLRSTTGGGGVTFASIAASDGRTFYAHHHVPVNKTSYITGLSVGHTGTVVGSGCVFTIRTRDSGSNIIEKQISDFVRLYGQSSTVTRNWDTALKVPGPSKITVYAQPESATSVTFRAAIDLYDQ